MLKVDVLLFSSKSEKKTKKKINGVSVLFFYSLLILLYIRLFCRKELTLKMKKKKKKKKKRG
jgi:glycopeptide antibiotics resistance protein